MSAKDHIKTIRAKIDDVKTTMIVNIEKILDRGDKLEEIDLKTDELQANSIEFKNATKTLKRSMCMKYCCIVMLLASIITCIAALVIIVILAIVLSQYKKNEF